ncbi:ABC transporter permease [Paremcibacter congregatus]|uniref:Transport permease protein n=1 Tax=Paremcibacter congregatus TaxID=2043170 RepID=A0A2G4YUD5_9PROT|nr:ABC transporter permease [Paremcibacter congregatus]PHZ85958.1 multidrug ABC transporter permease [Paremcibacter congregatus]QDE26923.1 multidrug ABC transporter permease [Paremcibacter congregatus]|tara:strand:- start:7049 stop:7873 length:825 start_codon:yes stop_codon:yes gene_type:complete
MEHKSKNGPALPAFGEKRIGAINWLGVWTLYAKEVRRFFKVVGQTVLSPVITTALFMTIFTIALSGSPRYNGDIPFEAFLAPGLIIMAILQNAFANTISSLMTAKMQGNIIDLLLAPLGPGEMTFAYTLAAVTRGMLVGIFVTASMYLFTNLSFPNLWAVAYFGLSAATMLALLGIMAGIWAEKWEQSSSITNFVIVPLSFLSGTFYSIDRLPGIWHDISQLNPFFYLIDGFRYGIIDHADGNLTVGVVYIAALNVILTLACYRMFSSGYKLRP